MHQNQHKYGPHPKKDSVDGSLFKMQDGSEVIVISYVSAKKILVQFTDKKTNVFHAHIGNLRKGKYKNPYQPSVQGVGYIGQGKFNKKQYPRQYGSWSGILARCYSEREQEERPSLFDITVDHSWHNFQVFCEWHLTQPYEEGWETDKDLLFKNNSHYSEETCCLIPRLLNGMLPKRNKHGVHYNKSCKAWCSQVRRLGGKGRISFLADNPSEAMLKAAEYRRDSLFEFATNKWKNLPPKVLLALSAIQTYLPCLDNEERLGTPYKIINKECPVHGNPVHGEMK